MGADGILVPNLETSTVGDQLARFEHLARHRVLPKLIELGNEFYLARFGDPALMRTWPDEPTAMAVMRRYEQALRPIVGEGGTIAVRSAASTFGREYPPAGILNADVSKPSTLPPYSVAQLV